MLKAVAQSDKTTEPDTLETLLTLVHTMLVPLNNSLEDLTAQVRGLREEAAEVRDWVRKVPVEVGERHRQVQDQIAELDKGARGLADRVTFASSTFF